MDRNLPDTIRADSLVFPSLTEVDAISNGNAVGGFDTNSAITFGQFIEFAGKNFMIDRLFVFNDITLVSGCCVCHFVFIGVRRCVCVCSCVRACICARADAYLPDFSTSLVYPECI